MVVPGYVYDELDRSVAPAVRVAFGVVVVGAFAVGAAVCWAVDRFERRRR